MSRVPDYSFWTFLLLLVYIFHQFLGWEQGCNMVRCWSDADTMKSLTEVGLKNSKCHFASQKHPEASSITGTEDKIPIQFKLFSLLICVFWLPKSLLSLSFFYLWVPIFVYLPWFYLFYMHTGKWYTLARPIWCKEYT